MTTHRLSHLIFSADELIFDDYEIDEDSGVILKAAEDGVAIIQLRANGGDDRWYFMDQDVTDFKDGEFTATDTRGDPHNLYAYMVQTRPMALTDIKTS